METNQIQENNFEEKQLQLQPEAESLLKETTKWTKFLAILSFIVLGLVTLIFLIGLLASPGLGGYGLLFGLIMIGTFALYFYPTYLLYKFSNEISLALLNRKETTLTDGFRRLKSYFKFNGIIAIVVICIYVFYFIVAAIFLVNIGRGFGEM